MNSLCGDSICDGGCPACFKLRAVKTQSRPTMPAVECPKERAMAVEVPRYSPPPDVESPELSARCEACGRHHGSEGALISCMRAEIRRLRNDKKAAGLER
jgi:hypothetical protein